jgi:membrane-associated HD superfamily phosphohydrolase
MLDRTSMAKRGLLFLMTAGVLFGALAIGQGKPGVTLEVGEVSPVQFIADKRVVVVDEAATAASREIAVAAVDPRFQRLEQVEGEVRTKISDVFDDVESLVVAADPTLPPVPDLPEEPSNEPASTTSSEGEPVEPEPAVLRTVTGQVFLDVNDDLLFDEAVDVPLLGIDVLVVGADGSRTTVSTDIDGSFLAPAVVVGGDVIILVDLEDPSLPASVVVASGNRYQRHSAVSADLKVEPVAFKPNYVDRDSVVDTLLATYPDLDLATIGTLVDLARADVILVSQGRTPQLSQIELKALDEAGFALDAGISEIGVQNARVQMTQSPPVVAINGQVDEAAGLAAADLAGVFLVANVVEDPEAFANEQARVAEEVPAVEVTFRAGDTIVAAGEEITQPVQAAIDALSLNRPDPVGYGALGLLSAVLVLMLFVYLARFRPGFWASDRRVSLLGLILVLAGLATRGIELASDALPALEGVIGYALPAAGFGFMISIVFDARIAVLASLAIGTMAGVVFGDAGYVIYAALATVAPVPLVSAISSNADQRRAIATTGVASAVIAFAT